VLSPACIANPNGFLFWDDLHPTAQGHQFLADAVIEAVPEPATGLLLVAGLFGLGALRRRRAEPNI
jgi:phospholipase/lecithinase/hemolysin